MAKHVKGADKVRARWDAAIGLLEEGVANELVKAAETTRTLVVTDIRRQKLTAGVKPEAGPGRRKHIPSPPYGPPNSDTGRLIASYTTDLIKVGATLTSRVIAGVLYALWLEFGTAKMLPRPHLLPRFREQATALRDRLAEIARRLRS